MGVCLIREMAIADLDEIMAIEAEAFPSPWTREMYMRELVGNPAAFCRVLTEDSRVIGYIDYWRVHEEGHIMTIAVAVEYRGRGLGERLLRYAMEELYRHRVCKLLLEVRPSNSTARQLYRKHGFQQLGVRRAYYSENGEDALVLECDLAAAYDRYLAGNPAEHARPVEKRAPGS